jgi:hypothetical protein
MVRKVYEVDPMTCPRCGGRMRVAAFLTEYAVIDRIIRTSARRQPGALNLEMLISARGYDTLAVVMGRLDRRELSLAPFNMTAEI